jgi:hypothetical protein
MRLKYRISALLALMALALVAVVPAAVATPLPAPTTHQDPTSQVDATPAQADSGDAPRITLFRSSTTSKLVKHGYLAIDVRCNLPCVISVVATGKVNKKTRVLGSAEKTLPANKVRTIKIRIRSDVKKLVQNGLKFKFDATPSAVL